MRKSQKAFDTLDVSPCDDMTTIRMAWRAKVRALHPDRAKDKRWATERLAEVNAAFDALQGHVPIRPEPKPRTEAVPPRAKAPSKARTNLGTSSEMRASRTTADGNETTRTASKAKRDAVLEALRLRAEAGYARALQNVKAA